MRQFTVLDEVSEFTAPQWEALRDLRRGKTWHHNLLPASVQRALQEAAQVEPLVAPGESLLRIRAIEAVIVHAARKYPHLFTKHATKFF